MGFLNSEGTSRDIYKIGKESSSQLKNNNGILEVKDSEGNFIPVLNRLLTIVGDTTLNADFNLILIKADSLVTLPSPNTFLNRVLTLKSGGSYDITISGDGSAIDGSYDIIALSSFASLNLLSDGENWYLI